MIKLKDLLVEEIFPSKQYDIEYDEMDGSLLSVDYTFTTPDNQYKVTFYSGEYNANDKTFDVSFGLYKDQGYKLHTFQLTGEGKVYSIIRTICEIIEEFVQEFGDDVEKLNIEGTSEERSRIYKALIPKYLDPAILQIVTIK
jgi:hypothetical protein